MDKIKEYWIDPIDNSSDGHGILDAYRSIGSKHLEPQVKARLIHVIEHAALAEAQAEIENLQRELRIERALGQVPMIDLSDGKDTIAKLTAELAEVKAELKNAPSVYSGQKRNWTSTKFELATRVGKVVDIKEIK